MNSRRPLFIAASAGMFVFGNTLAILGVLFGLPAMRGRIHADLAQQGDVFLMLYLGIFVSTIIVGPIIDSFRSEGTRLNSCHLVISYAVFCLKKKKKTMKVNVSEKKKKKRKKIKPIKQNK